MSLFRNCVTVIFSTALAFSFSVSATFAQGRVSLRGAVVDEFGAAIVGASVTLTDAGGNSKVATTAGDGAYVFSSLPLGKYTIHAAATGFSTSDEVEVDLTSARHEPFNIALKVAIIESQVNVTAETQISTEASNNANQIVITGRDMEALPDDPDEMAAALQALAGPSVGPNGGQIFIDGFSSGDLPPKESIREIRINRNPFAAENDQPSARIDILTKPGTNKFHGMASFNFTDESLDSRNPFAATKTAFQVRHFEGNFSGPLKQKKASFFIDFARRGTDDNELVRATVLDPSLNIVQVSEGVLVPRRVTSFSPRVDYAINSHNTLVARYSYNHWSTANNGVGGFSLPERSYDSFSTNQNIQLTETAVLNSTTINETGFQFVHNHSEQLGDSSTPTTNVSGAFIAGGSQVGHAINNENRWELNNFTSKQKSTHTIKFGGRIRHVQTDSISPNNFGGQWLFSGGFGPRLDANNNVVRDPVTGQPIIDPLTSIETYRRTLLFQQQGMTPEQIRALGGGAAQFTINIGNPEAGVSQTDVGVFFQDDWRVKPNLTFSYGLRYETQTNAHSKYDFAPRLAFAWSPGGGSSSHPPKTVIRGGAGIFYNRFSESATLQATRFNGINQQQGLVSEQVRRCASGSLELLNSFPNVPVLTSVPQTCQTIWQVAQDLVVPTIYVVGAQVERQLPHNLTVTAGAYALGIRHAIRARDINAPPPATITSQNPSGIRPDPTRGDIYQYESSGRINQRNFFVGLNSRLNPRVSIFANYVFSKSEGDTDGFGGALFPANQYDLSTEFGRTSFDVHHRFTLFGTINLPWWKLVLSPFVIASSGRPFNITIGRDLFRTGQLTARPSFAGPNADCTAANIVCTSFGNFNLAPGPGDQIIPRNFGQGPGYFSVNLRLSRTFGFGGETGQGAPSQGGKRGEGGRGPGGPVIMGGGGGGPRGGGGDRGFGGFGGGTNTGRKYNLIVSLNAQNLFNHANLGNPVGDLSSPLFGQSTNLQGGFGGFGGGGPGSTGAPNRRIYAQIRFTF